jgi:hypothetical protein
MCWVIRRMLLGLLVRGPLERDGRRAYAAFTPSTTQGRHPRSRGAPVETTMASSVRCSRSISCSFHDRAALFHQTQSAHRHKAKHAIIFQEGTETSSKKLSVSLFAATQVATHPGISSSDDQDMIGRVRYGSPNAC